MKFKMQDKQNQLIERISTLHNTGNFYTKIIPEDSKDLGFFKNYLLRSI
ncbi:hypothetical protein SH601_09740 [Gracilibacillus sp. S3-1-1]|uniref:Uncharacterized protein n=1 Tax=Gracilibacillus pellucidus TaxID=3095368 RepID=A0ACC6M5L7_9BACI|nr:hypothetical protein [Gracilibacillus sp. S3-1-1]MDX8046273.1 hypothetical protein [Gracilibacillus sp. S3-1-1]